MEEGTRKKKVLISGVAMFLLLLTVIGISYAVFTFVGRGEKENTISSGAVTIVYTEGNELNITNAMPISDETGKMLSGTNNVFTFTVQANITGSNIIAYEIAAIKKDTSTLKDDEIKIYLEKNDNEVFYPSHFIPIEAKTEIGSPEGSMIIDQGIFTAGTTNNYTMKMWVDENAEITDKVKTYTVTVNVYAKDGFTTSKIVQVETYGLSSYFLLDSGDLYGMGYNLFGQIGDGTTENRNTPYKIMDNVKEIAVGRRHVLILTNENELYGTGYNIYGQIGDGTTENKTTPVKTLENVRKIWATDMGSFVEREDGNLYATGYNEFGQLGVNSTTNILEWTLVEGLHGVIDIEGFSQTLFLLDTHEVYATGKNNLGQLMDGTTEDTIVPKKVMDNIIDIAVGNATNADNGFSFALKNTGELYAVGYNKNGQLMDGLTENVLSPEKVMEDIKEIAARNGHSLVLKNNGDLYVAGYNINFAIGAPTTGNIITPTKLMENIEFITTGSDQTFVRDKNGIWYGAGSNSYGQFGDNSTEKKRKFEKLDLLSLVQ